MSSDIRSAITQEKATDAVVNALASQLGSLDAKAVLFFCSHQHDGAAISLQLKKRYPQAEVIGCTTAGELTNTSSLTGGVSALALGPGKVKRAAGALAKFGTSVDNGVKTAIRSMSEALKADVRELDAASHVGIVLVEGLKGKEEEANEALGNAAPHLSFVGGSAGDNLEFKETRVFYNGEASNDGAALLLLETAVPFTVVKTCSFKPSGKEFTVTKADVPNRVIYELDGKPVAQVYAQAVGVSPEKLDGNVFMSHPVGLMIDGKPWIRSPQQLLPNGGLKFFCRVLEGMKIHLMDSTHLVDDTKSTVAQVKKSMPAVSGGLTFNCILRRLELDAQKSHPGFLTAFDGLQTAGFHTYGESWLGHINQTLTAVLFG
jgi:hypothetical protein